MFQDTHQNVREDARLGSNHDQVVRSATLNAACGRLTSPAAIGVQQSIAEGPEILPWVLFGASVIWVYIVQPLLGHAHTSATAPAGYSHGPSSWSVSLHRTHRCWVHWSDFVGGQHLPATLLVRIGMYTTLHGTASVHWRGFAHMACMQCWHGGATGFKRQQCQYVWVDQGSTLHTQHFYSLGTQHRLPRRLHDCNQTFHYCGKSTT